MDRSDVAETVILFATITFTGVWMVFTSLLERAGSSHPGVKSFIITLLLLSPMLLVVINYIIKRNDAVLETIL